GQNLRHPTHYGIFFGMHGMLRSEQLESRVQQERPEQVENPIKSLNQNGAQANHRGAHHQRAQHPPEQQAMLVAGIDSEILEDQQEDEDIVHTERFFNDVAGEKLEAGPAPVRE